MSDIMNHMQTARATGDIKSALREIGCDVSKMDSISDAAQIIRNECVSGPNAVVNATLDAGAGIRIIPIGRKGYKISSTSGSILETDLAEELPKGTTVHKVLHSILYKAIPAAMKKAAAAPSIVRIDLIKMSYDGVDYYENPAFSPKGQGRRSGLTPGAWYIRLFTAQMKEPFYLDLNPMLGEMKKSILMETRRMMESYVAHVMENHLEADHHRFDPPRPPHHDHDCDCDCGHHHHPCHPCHHPVDRNQNGFCDNCGFPIESHKKPQPCDNPEDYNQNGICDNCGFPMDEHKQDPEPPIYTEPCDNSVDRDGDGLCDVCGFRVEKHGPSIGGNPNDMNGDGLCDDCELPVAQSSQEFDLEKYLSGNGQV